MMIAFDRKNPGRWIGTLLLLAFMIAFSISANASTGVNVDVHTPDEIRAYISMNGPQYLTTSYEKTPDKSKGSYVMGDEGALSNAVMQDALKMLNTIRYIAGLSYNVQLDENYTKMAQAGAFINDVNDEMNHEPPQPEGMADDLYQLGYAGTSTSNLAWASYDRPLADTTLDWMSDESGFNLTCLGHRRWQINPKLQAVGFGHSGKYSAIRIFDESGAGGQTGVVWPAQNMPVDYFDETLAWSYSLGRTISNAVVTLKQKRDGQEIGSWAFNQQSTEENPGKSGYYYKINNQNYGQPGCIIFRPDNVSYRSGDVFEVSITGDVTASYTVQFFAITPVESILIPENLSLTEGATRKIQTQILPANASETIPIWSSADESVATVDINGNVTAVGEIGTSTTITARIGEITSSCTVTIGIDISKADVSITNADRNSYRYYYTGNPIIPELEVMLDNKELVADQDYTVSFPSYSDNVNPSNNYIQRFTVTGCGKYAGSISSKYIVIDPRPIGHGTITAEVSTPVFSGSEVTPEIVLTFNKGKEDEKVLTPGTDYEITKITGEKINAGKTGTVTITGKGNYSLTRQETFTINPAPINDCNISIPEQTYTSQQLSPVVTVSKGDTELTASQDYTYTPDKATAAGNTTITVTGQGNYTGTKTGTFTIKPASLNDAQIAFKNPDAIYTYSGEPITPAVEVKLSGEGGAAVVLPEADYKVEYASNTDAGTAKVTVSPSNIENLKDSAGPLDFTIKQADLSTAENVNITLEASELVFNGTVQNPEVTKVEVGGRTLIAGKDYSVTLPGVATESGTDGQSVRDKELYVIPGKYLVRVTGTGNYTGYQDATVTISQASLESDQVTIQLSKDTYIYSGSANTPEVYVKIGNYSVPNENEENFSVAYDKNINAGTGVVTVTAKADGVLKNSEEETFTIEPLSISGATVQLSGSEVLYDGMQHRPEIDAVTVRTGSGDSVLTLLDTEYTVSYGENVNAGDSAGSVTITAADNGNYKDAVTKTFAINPTSLTAGNVNIEVSNVTYTGGTVDPQVSVKINGNVISDENYDVSVKGNVNAGDVTATITATGSNLTNSAKKGYRILPASMAGAEVTLQENSFIYTGEAIEPIVESVETTDHLLPAAADYTLAYENNVNAGTAKMVLTGTGNYTDTAEKEFSISPAPLTDAEVTASDVVYTGAPVTTTLSVEKNGTKLENAKDYSVSYDMEQDYTNAGQASVKAVGCGNYTGEKEATFTILAADISHVTVSASDQTWTGSELNPAVTAKLNGQVLPEADYTVEYSDNIAAGNATIKITPSGNGNLTGTYATGTFVINEKPADPKPDQREEDPKPDQNKEDSRSDQKEDSAPGQKEPQTNPNPNGVPTPDPVLGTRKTLEAKAKSISENGDPKGSTFSLLQMTAKKITKTSIRIGWKAVPKAAGYVVYGAPCGAKYGKLKEVKGTSFTQDKLKKGKYYKYFVAAYDKNGNILAASRTIHVATSGGKKGNPKSVKLNKKKVTLKKGKTFNLKATQKKGKLKAAKHRKVAYETDNNKVATVSGSGKIKAVGAGTCNIYAYTQDGKFAKCKVTVKK